MNYIKLLYRLIGLTIFFVGSNYIYKQYFFEHDLQLHSPIINDIRKVKNENYKVVYLGESSNTTFHPLDNDKRSISEIMASFFPEIKCGNLNKEASHAGIFLPLLENIDPDAQVETIILTLNLRSFDASWRFSNLETALEKSLVLLKPYPPLFNRFLLTFKAYDIKSDIEREKQFKQAWKKEVFPSSYQLNYKNVIEWDKALFHNGILNEDKSRNQPLTELACHYVKTYAFHIDTLNNPRIRDLDNIVAYCSKRKWNLIFNLLGENIDRGEELVGPELIKLIKDNRDLLLKRYNNKNCVVVDNLEKIRDRDFIDQRWTTEHYTERARRIIAKQVALALKNIYPDQFRDQDFDLIGQHEFYSDCEGHDQWHQIQTLDSTMSYSGKKSSKTNKENPYSLTFEIPVKELKDSIHNVDISFQLWPQELSDEVKLVIEWSGQYVEQVWNGLDFKHQNLKTKNWNTVNFSFKLPSGFYRSDKMKIYLLNSTDYNYYMDDIRIIYN